MTDPLNPAEAMREAAVEACRTILDRALKDGLSSRATAAVNCMDAIRALPVAETPAPVVKVKPLVWERFDTWTFWAKSCVGTYRVQERNGVWKAVLVTGASEFTVYEYTTDGLTPDDFHAAICASDGDYKSRILSAIETAPAPFMTDLMVDPESLDAFMQDDSRTLPITQADGRTLTGVWPDFIAPSKFAAPDPRWTDPGLPDFRLIWKLAREVGYAVGLHGSMKRDCDLIAAPWTDEAVSAEALIDHLCAGLDAFKLGDGLPVIRPHGRRAWAIQQRDGWKKHIDISVMPRGGENG